MPEVNTAEEWGAGPEQRMTPSEEAQLRGDLSELLSTADYARRDAVDLLLYHQNNCARCMRHHCAIGNDLAVMVHRYERRFAYLARLRQIEIAEDIIIRHEDPAAKDKPDAESVKNAKRLLRQARTAEALADSVIPHG